MMKRTYERKGFTLEVTVESVFMFGPFERSIVCTDYVALVRVFRGGETVAVFTPTHAGTPAPPPRSSDIWPRLKGCGWLSSLL